MKKLILAFVMVLFSLSLAYGFSDSERKFCNWFSTEAGDIMYARQNGVSETALKDEYRNEYQNNPEMADSFLNMIDACYDVKMVGSKEEMYEEIERVQENAYNFCKKRMTEN